MPAVVVHEPHPPPSEHRRPQTASAARSSRSARPAAAPPASPRDYGRSPKRAPPEFKEGAELVKLYGEAVVDQALRRRGMRKSEFTLYTPDDFASEASLERYNDRVNAMSASADETNPALAMAPDDLTEADRIEYDAYYNESVRLHVALECECKHIQDADQKRAAVARRQAARARAQSGAPQCAAVQADADTADDVTGVDDDDDSALGALMAQHQKQIARERARFMQNQKKAIEATRRKVAQRKAEEDEAIAQSRALIEQRERERLEAHEAEAAWRDECRVRFEREMKAAADRKAALRREQKKLDDLRAEAEAQQQQRLHSATVRKYKEMHALATVAHKRNARVDEQLAHDRDANPVQAKSTAEDAEKAEMAWKRKRAATVKEQRQAFEAAIKSEREHRDAAYTRAKQRLAQRNAHIDEVQAHRADHGESWMRRFMQERRDEARRQQEQQRERDEAKARAEQLAAERAEAAQLQFDYSVQKAHDCLEHRRHRQHMTSKAVALANDATRRRIERAARARAEAERRQRDTWELKMKLAERRGATRDALTQKLRADKERMAVEARRLGDLAREGKPVDMGRLDKLLEATAPSKARSRGGTTTSSNATTRSASSAR